MKIKANVEFPWTVKGQWKLKYDLIKEKIRESKFNDRDLRKTEKRL